MKNRDRRFGIAEGMLRNSAPESVDVPSREHLSAAELEELDACSQETMDSLIAILRASTPMLRSVTQSETTVLNALASGFDGSSPAQLAANIGVTRARLTQIVSSLESGGLVTKEPDPEDHRKLRVLITDKGRAAVDAQRLNFKVLIENYFLLVGAQDMREVNRLMCRTASIVNEFDMTATSELLGDVE